MLHQKLKNQLIHSIKIEKESKSIKIYWIKGVLFL